MSRAEVEEAEWRQKRWSGGGWGRRWLEVGGEGEGRSYHDNLELLLPAIAFVESPKPSWDRKSWLHFPTLLLATLEHFKHIPRQTLICAFSGIVFSLYLDLGPLIAQSSIKTSALSG